MKRVNGLIAGLVAVGALGACSKLSGPAEPHILELKSETLITNTASSAHTFVHDRSNERIICSQPHPDAAFDEADESQTTIALISTSEDQAGMSVSTEEVELAGRTPTVLMTRELFFRACEFSYNYKLDKEEALELYNKTLDAIAETWAVEAGNTQVSIGDTVSNSTTATISETSTQTLSDEATTSLSDSETESTSETTDTSTSN